MAESGVSFLFNQLTLLLQQEQELLGGIRNNAVYIRDELGHMRAFLRAADEKEESDPQLKEWVKQVREITYDTEDVLERYMLELSHLHRDANGWKRYVKKMYASAKKLMVRHQIASDFQKIKLRMENSSKSQQRFKDSYDFKDQVSSNKMYDGRGDALLLEEADVVGIEEPKKQLVEWLMQTDDGLMVISVVGMGGLGKTTLVKKIYDDASVKANFNIHVWVTVSEDFNLERLLRNMINQLANEVKRQPPQNLEAMNSDEMKEFVNKFLKDIKTYMIVLDDVWKIDAWESIRYAFPRNNACGRIIMTTRLYNIGNAACSETCGHLYNLDPLTAENSRKLFYRKTFSRNSCPFYLNDISESILKRCGGLPLAIVVIGGLLATKNNDLEDWKMFEHTIGLELQGDSLKRMNKLLSLSYYDMPYYLKACFLYLSIFSEDELFSKWKVIRLWIAEGFVEAKDGKTLEDVAETYLNELLNRSLIQVADTYSDGRPKRFRIHDILREFIISKSREQNLLVGACREMKCHDRIRRMAINARFNDEKESYNVKYLRSLFWLEFADSRSGLIFQNVLGHCRLLKVLDLNGAPIDSIPNKAFKLYHLKYLNLRSTNVKVIPKSIGNLQNLETLNLKQSKVIELPVEILKLHKLRQLLVYTYNGDFESFAPVAQSLKAPYKIGSYLTSLQKLCWIDADEADGMKIVREIGKLTQLRNLGISKLRREDGRDLCSSLAKLTNLRLLRIQSIEEDEVMDLDHSLSSSTLPFLRTIYLHGRLEKFPQWVYSLHGLTELHLRWSRLREDPLQHLEGLPNLVFLEMSLFSYEGEELIFEGGKFQKLKKLVLGKFRRLRCVRVGKGSMPHLEKLVLWKCSLMEELPEGIEHLSNLQIVEFYNMSGKFKGRLAEERKHKGKLAHASKVEVWDQVNNEWKMQRL